MTDEQKEKAEYLQAGADRILREMNQADRSKIIKSDTSEARDLFEAVGLITPAFRPGGLSLKAVHGQVSGDLLCVKILAQFTGSSRVKHALRMTVEFLNEDEKSAESDPRTGESGYSDDPQTEVAD